MMDILGSMKQELLMDSPSGLAGSTPSSLWTNPTLPPPPIVQARPVVSHLRKDLAQGDLTKSEKDPFQMLSMFYKQQQTLGLQQQSLSKGAEEVTGSTAAAAGPMTRDPAMKGSPSLSRIRAKKKRGRMMMMQEKISKRADESNNSKTAGDSQPENSYEVDVKTKTTTMVVDVDESTNVVDSETSSLDTTADVVASDTNTPEGNMRTLVEDAVESPIKERKRRKRSKTVRLSTRSKETAPSPDKNEHNDGDEVNINNSCDDMPTDDNDNSFVDIEKLDSSCLSEEHEIKDCDKPSKEGRKVAPIKIIKKRKKTPEELEALKNKERPFLCKFCGKTYLTKKNLRYHEVCHSDERRYICDYPNCGKGFKLNAHLKTHKYMHGEENRFVCSFEGCDKAYKTPDTLRLHEQIHQPGKFVCEFAGCGKSFPVKRRLSRHIRRSHRDNRKFPCTFRGCERVCTSKSNLKEHMEGHCEDRERFTCKICNKVMMSEHTLKRHIKQVHCAERNFMCAICGKRYKTKSNLLQHVNIHMKHAMREGKTDSKVKEKHQNNNNKSSTSWDQSQSCSNNEITYEEYHDTAWY